MYIVLFLSLILVNVYGNVLCPWIVLLVFSHHEGISRAVVNYPVGISIIFIMVLILLIYGYRKVN